MKKRDVEEFLTTLQYEPYPLAQDPEIDYKNGTVTVEFQDTSTCNLYYKSIYKFDPVFDDFVEIECYHLYEKECTTIAWDTNKKLWGLVENDTAREILPFEYDAIEELIDSDNGTKSLLELEYYKILKNGLWGITDNEGHIIEKPQFSDIIEPNIDGICPVQDMKTKKWKYYKIGQGLVPNNEHKNCLSEWNEDLARASKNAEKSKTHLLAEKAKLLSQDKTIDR